ncbi:tape measure protein [Rhizobium sp. YJ-22]|uniref:tape measure protein n=1 Tax=Rhizobium sp. YJ-22 TaxID=3037556 RepID=UPI002412359A|nr:tape measure protein [Rhizobium sp. YJ-22]MDG3575731.1 tape measure protein [Rhizobium sp. YJ-22]
MADGNTEQLAIDVVAKISALEKQMAKANAITARAYRDMSASSRAATKQMEQDMIRSTIRINQALAATSTKIGSFSKAFAGAAAGALSVREVIAYADAWTTAKNSLAVAGVVGRDQVKVLDALYQSAQKNAAPVQALADLFGKAAQASDNLGASQKDLLKFSGGVATALRVAGTSATAASGALTQLGQLLGAARVQAEEFNSVNEGARPILIAVANGLDAAGGSVSKLKTLVNDGKVSSQQFFNAFLKGLPTIEAMAANSTQTIEQGWTKVNNAMTKYVGETDSSLGASQRLVEGLNTLADNFDETADRAVQLASVIAGALVGRSLFGMIATLGKGTEAIIAFSRALATARTAGGLAAAFGGLGAAAGPVGLLIGGTVVTALMAFSSSSKDASEGAKLYAQTLKEVEERAKGADAAIKATTVSIDEKEKNRINDALGFNVKDIEETRASITDMFEQMFRNADFTVVTPEQLDQLKAIRDGFDNGTKSAKATEQALYGLANANPDIKGVADAFSPLLVKLENVIATVQRLKGELASVSAVGPSFRETENASMDAYRKMKEQADSFIKEQGRRASLTRDQLSLEAEIAKVRGDAAKQGVTLTEKQIEQAARLNIEGEKARDAEKKTRGRKVSEYDGITRSIREQISAMQSEAAALGMVGAAATAYRIEQELVNDALVRGVNVTPQMRDGFRQLAAEAGAAEEALSAMKLSHDLLFERQQMGRTETERRVYSELRSANIDINSQAGTALAQQIRLNEAWREAQDELQAIGDIGKDALGGIVDALYESGNAAENLLSVFAGIGRQFAKLGADKLWKSISGQGGIDLSGATSMTPQGGSALVQVGKQLSAAVAPAVTQGLSTGLDTWAAAIRKIESGSYEGNYGAIGPLVRKGQYAGQRAIGAYQVMPGNVPSWTKEALGYSMTAKQFLLDRAAQDKVVLSRLQGSFDKFGNWIDAASVHFSGGPLKSAKPGQNDGYNTVPKYLSMVNSAADKYPGSIRQGVTDGIVDANRKMANTVQVQQQSASQASMPQMSKLEGMLGVGGAALGAFSGGYQSGSPLMGGLSGAMSGFGAAGAIASAFPALAGVAGPVGAIGGAIVGPCIGKIGRKRSNQK